MLHTTDSTADPLIPPAWVTSFLDSGLYLRGWSERTCRTYPQSSFSIGYDGAVLTTGQPPSAFPDHTLPLAPMVTGIAAR